MICGSSGRTGASSAGGASATSSAQSSDISTSERQEILTSETITWNQRLPKLDRARARLRPRGAPWSTTRSAGSPSWLPGSWCLRWTILEAEPVEITSQYVLSTEKLFKFKFFLPVSIFMNVILTQLAEGIQMLPWRRRAIFSRLPASVPHHLNSRSSFSYMTLFNLEHCL